MTGIQDQTRACPVPPHGAAPDARTGAPRPSGPTHSPEARRTAHSPSTRFSPTDLALVHLIADGLDNPQIAAKLGIGVERVKSDIKRLATRHQASDRAALVATACRSGQIGHGTTALPPRLAVVLAEVAAGRTNPQIAARLHLSVDGVKSRLRDLLAWLGANGRANAVYLAHQAGLLPKETT